MKNLINKYDFFEDYGYQITYNLADNLCKIHNPQNIISPLLSSLYIRFCSGRMCV